MREGEFNKDRLMRSSSLQLANPAGFQMQQSYSMQFTSSTLGSFSSGLYLNTISYQFGIPLKLSLDFGVYNLLYASGFSSGVGGQQQSLNLSPSDSKPMFVIPRIALSYRPTANTLLCLQFTNYTDAVHSYGSPYYASPLARHFDGQEW